MRSGVKAASVRMEKQDALKTVKGRKWVLQKTEGPEDVKLINPGHTLNEYQSCDWNQVPMSSQGIFLQHYSASPSLHFDNDNN